VTTSTRQLLDAPELEARDPTLAPARTSNRPRDDLAAIYGAYAPAVAAWAARLAGPTADLEDLVQEVFLVVERKISSFRGEAKMTTWLYRITHNVVRAYRRKARFRRWLSGSAEDAAGRIPAGGPTPIEELERRRAQATVYRALERMGDKQRTVFILFELEGLSGQQIAELTGTKLNAVWVRLHRARADFERRVRADLVPMGGAP
jgi:RNA polymerase sigma-70 factor (ECF subfamily)